MGELYYGGVPVPWTVGWSGEEGLFLDHCRFAGGVAICQRHEPGVGKPQFGKPHAVRQRQCVVESRCDLCGKPLAARTKVSLSHARPQPHAASFGDILQVEPLLHKECAALSMLHCPSLKRDIRVGSLMVRQVNRFAVQVAIMSEVYCQQVAGQHRKAFGHAKVQLIAWTDRNEHWLEAAPQPSARRRRRDAVR